MDALIHIIIYDTLGRGVSTALLSALLSMEGKCVTSAEAVSYTHLSFYINNVLTIISGTKIQKINRILLFSREKYGLNLYFLMN